VKRVFLASLCCLSLSGICHAAGWTGELTVSSTFTEGTTDLIIVYTADGSTYASGCTVNAWSFSADTDARRGRAYATVMAALASGKKIKLWYNDTCGTWGYHQATTVMLVN
jgi:hypothetical protein